jgi:cold shock CspA family protein
MQNGTIIELTERSSGFIKRKGVKDHLFFHADFLVGVDFKELKKGQKVCFKVTETNKGPYAIGVTRV